MIEIKIIIDEGNVDIIRDGENETQHEVNLLNCFSFAINLILKGIGEVSGTSNVVQLEEWTMDKIKKWNERNEQIKKSSLIN